MIVTKYCKICGDDFRYDSEKDENLGDPENHENEYCNKCYENSCELLELTNAKWVIRQGGFGDWLVQIKLPPNKMGSIEMEGGKHRDTAVRVAEHADRAIGSLS